MKRSPWFSPTVFFSLLCAGLVLPASACYSVGGRAPAGGNVALAGPHESCVETARKRVHFGLAGLVPLHDSSIEATPGTRARIASDTDVIDIVLRTIGYSLTFGLYGGTQSVMVETCYGAPPAQVAGGPVPPPAPPAPPAPAPSRADVTIQLPAVSLGSRRTSGRPAPTRRYSDQPMCSNSLDCGSGEFCKDRGDGIKMCMGKGLQGDFCKSGIDCESLSCKDPGDGFKVCMGSRH